MIIPLLFLTGLLIGILSAFFGVGGGIIAVPMIYTIFPKILPQTAIASSLGMICLNSCLNTFNFIRAGKKPLLKLIIIIGMFMSFGVLIGGQLTLILPPKTIKLIFGCVLVIVSVKTIFTKPVHITLDKWEPDLTPKFVILTCLFSIIGGLVAGITGLGGGAILVPLFISVLKFPITWVSVYSNAAMAIGTFVGTMSYIFQETPEPFIEDQLFSQLQFGHLNVAISLFFFAGAFITSRYGVKLVKKVPAHISKNLFAVLLLIVAIKIFTTT